MAKKQPPFDALDDFEKVEFTYAGSTKSVYRKGKGPAVVVMTEIPGITPKVADFARRVAGIGCTVAMPSLYGVDGRRPTSGYLATSVSKVCVSREFTTFTTGQSSPVIVWLRALARELHQRRKILLRAEDLGLEAAHLAGRSGLLLRLAGSAAHHVAHREIDAQPVARR